MKRILATLAVIVVLAGISTLAQFPVGTGSGGAADPNTVTAAGTLTANLPVIGGGSKAVAVGTRSGNTTAFVTTTGTQTSGRCVEIDANGNHIAAAAGCAASGALVGPLDSCVANNSASCDLDGWYNANYDVYELVFVNVVPATSGTALNLRFSEDAGMSYITSAIYKWTRVETEVGGGPSRGGADSQTAITLASPLSDTANKSASGTFRIYKPGGAMHKTIKGSVVLYNATSGNLQNHDYSGAYESTGITNALQLLMASGNIESGEFYVYALAK